jgi:hypothetical protein
MSFRDRRQADKARSPHYAGGRLLICRSRQAGISLSFEAMNIKRLNIEERARYLIGEAGIGSVQR